MKIVSSIISNKKKNMEIKLIDFLFVNEETHIFAEFCFYFKIKLKTFIS